MKPILGGSLTEATVVRLFLPGGPCRHVFRVAVLLIAAMVAWSVAATVGWAHAVLEEADPAPDSIVSSPPTEVWMRFNEPLIEGPTHATVIAPDGEEFTEVEVDGDAQEMRVALDTTVSGVYEVEWLTVSPIDGHTWEGTFEFRVEPAEADVEQEPADETADEAPGPPELETPPPDAPDDDEPGPSAEEPPAEPRERAIGRGGGLRLMAGAGRALEYLGWLAVLGWFTLGAVARSIDLGWVPRRLLPWVALAVVGAGLTVLAELLQAGGGSLAAGAGALLPTTAGWARAARLAVAILVLGIVVGATAGHDPAVPNRRTRVLAAMLTLAALVLLAASGHAASSGLALVFGAGPLITAGVWAGTIVVMAGQRPPGGWRGDTGRQLISELAPYGLMMFSATVLLGVLRAVQQLSSPSELWISAYGQMLLLKVLLVAAMLPLSWLAWRRAAPLLRVEGLLATGVVVLAAGLAILGPPPPRVTDAPEAALDADGDPADAEPPEAGLPDPEDLTLGGDAGTAVVGLSVRPGQPGDNEVFVYLVPTGGPDVAGGLETTLSVADGDPIPMASCGDACRTATVPLDGGEPVDVEVEVLDADQLHTATFTLPGLPAPDGTGLLNRAEQRMNQLATLRYDEVFGPHTPPTTSTWEIVAPDRIAGVITRGDDHHEIVRIEDRRWRRDGPDEPWEGGDPGGPGVTSNRFIWEEDGRTAARIVGSETIDGVSTREVAFFVNLSRGLPVWYRVWIDDDDLIRQAEMRARGHFMDHRYYDFDADIQIEAPN